MAHDFFIFSLNTPQIKQKLHEYLSENSTVSLKIPHSFTIENWTEIENHFWDKQGLSTEDLYLKLGLQEIIHFRSQPLNIALNQITQEYIETLEPPIKTIDGSFFADRETSLKIARWIYQVSEHIEEGMGEEDYEYLSEEERDALGMYQLEFEHWVGLFQEIEGDLFLWQHSF